MTMAKATTNGVVPMGVVAVKEEMYDTVLDASKAIQKELQNYFMDIHTLAYQLLLQQL